MLEALRAPANSLSEVHLPTHRFMMRHLVIPRPSSYFGALFSLGVATAACVDSTPTQGGDGSSSGGVLTPEENDASTDGSGDTTSAVGGTTEGDGDSTGGGVEIPCTELNFSDANGWPADLCLGPEGAIYLLTHDNMILRYEADGSGPSWMTPLPSEDLMRECEATTTGGIVVAALGEAWVVEPETGEIQWTGSLDPGARLLDMAGIPGTDSVVGVGWDRTAGQSGEAWFWRGSTSELNFISTTEDYAFDENTRSTVGAVVAVDGGIIAAGQSFDSAGQHLSSNFMVRQTPGGDAVWSAAWWPEGPDRAVYGVDFDQESGTVYIVGDFYADREYPYLDARDESGELLWRWEPPVGWSDDDSSGDHVIARPDHALVFSEIDYIPTIVRVDERGYEIVAQLDGELGANAVVDAGEAGLYTYVDSSVSGNSGVIQRICGL